jgi:type II secretory pathway pseudopilin PulG
VKVLIILAVLAVVGLIAWAITSYFSQRTRLSRQDKEELKALRNFYWSVDELAIENRDLDPTAIRLDLMIRDFRNRKELS